ncbi:MAG: GNAT family N-acetyltransferase [Mycobacteriales bacterium]
MEPSDISCGRLMLRPWTAYDEPDLLRGRNDPLVLRWTDTPAPYTPEHARAFLTEHAPAGWAAGTDATWAAREATTGDLVGGVALHRIGGGEAWLAYWCLPEGRGQGLATEMTTAVCRWGFGMLELERIGWACGVGNFASRATAQKIGFTVEGTARQAFVQRGTRIDDWVGSLLASDPMTDTRPLPSPPVLSDGVVTLRGWCSADAPDAARACDDPETARWLPVPSPYRLEDSLGFIEGYIARAWADGTAAELAVTDAGSGELVGAVALKLHQRRLGVGEVGYWTAPWARGRGVAGRAAALVARWGLEQLGLSRVELVADVRNTASQRAAEQAGFTREGVARRARLDRHGVAQDMVLFGLTAD